MFRISVTRSSLRNFTTINYNASMFTSNLFDSAGIQGHSWMSITMAVSMAPVRHRVSPHFFLAPRTASNKSSIFKLPTYSFLMLWDKSAVTCQFNSPQRLSLHFTCSQGPETSQPRAASLLNKDTKKMFLGPGQKLDFKPFFRTGSTRKY